MTSSFRVPDTLAFRSFSLLLALRVARALAFPRSSNLMNLPSESTIPKPLLAQLRAHSLVWLARSLFLHITSTTVPVQVSARAITDDSAKPTISFFMVTPDSVSQFVGQVGNRLVTCGRLSNRPG